MSKPVSESGSSGGLSQPPDPASTIFASRQILGAALTAWVSTSLTDDAWDAFLQTCPLGQFQQSSIWASVKSHEGWAPVRVVIREADVIVGGFQILVRSRGLLREGFLNKGPVYRAEDAGLLSWLVELVSEAARANGIDLLLTQAPDADRALEAPLTACGHAPNGLTGGIITATLCVQFGRDRPPADLRMSKSRLMEVRQSIRRGAVVREGGTGDVPCFFKLMAISCQRQNTSPNPPSEEAALRLWTAFHAKGLARLTFAECEGEPCAAILTLRFGNRVTQWKKGWNEQHREKHLNTLLSHESILWAESVGAYLYDFAGFDRSLARLMLSDKALDTEIEKSRYSFFLGFGPHPRLLPLPRVWFRNRVLRATYRMMVPALRKWGRIET